MVRCLAVGYALYHLYRYVEIFSKKVHIKLGLRVKLLIALLDSKNEYFMNRLVASKKKCFALLAPNYNNTCFGDAMRH